MNWLISANPKVYDHESSFNHSNSIDWRQGRTNYSIGDVVYIYVSHPDMHLRYKCIVQDVGLTRDNIRDDKSYWRDKDKYYNSLNGRYVRLHLLNKISSSELSFNQLIKNGMKQAPQSPIKLENNLELLEYIQSIFESEENEVLTLDDVSNIFYGKVSESLKDNQAARLARISTIDKKPTKKVVITEIYSRSPDIVAIALLRAKGVCERCNKKAPFNRKSDNTPYLEVHHVQSLSNGGADSLANVLALCPNCHRELHYG
ncbi:HNH endonuclease [Kosakonia pseudosacchari]|uniref:HNH endonuclease n=1 Tax=Kosakonia pseudosacchari TaxID=1646340 RepID=UPI001D13DA5C|nr:HNH endonuclease [Kosakonia pseudosacchari]